jgi:thymidylate synthase
MIEEKFSHNDINTQVYQLIEDLDSVGMKSSPRGQAVVEATMATLDINPTLPVMNFTERKFNWKYFVGELAWYLKGENTTDFISKFSSFWEGIKNPDGTTINSNYGAILLGDHPSTIYSKDSDGYPMPRVNQLKWAYDSLIKDEYSRQAIAFLNCPYYQFEGNKDFVCTAYLNFWIRKDYLDMKVQMRSNDIFFGLTYDAPWFSLLYQSMFLNLQKQYPDLKMGMYYHCADNIHYYERHFELVEKILETPPNHSPSLLLKTPLFEFQEFIPERGIEPMNKMVLTEEAVKFVAKVENIVNDPEVFQSMKSSDWKSLLTDLIEITD